MKDAAVGLGILGVVFALGVAMGAAFTSPSPASPEPARSYDQQQRARCVHMCGNVGVRRFEQPPWGGGDVCECR